MKKSTVIILCIIAGIIGTTLTVVTAIEVIRRINFTNCSNDPEEPIDKKPVIYLYSTEKEDITIKLGKPNNITLSYPIYNNGWEVVIYPDGTLIDKKTGRKLYSLYWEGKHTEPINLNEGFIVKNTDTINFLEEKLTILGLNEKESEEFIIYWLPILNKNKYNYIRFASIDEINKNMPLEISKEPDSMIRILMQYKPLNKKIEVKEQTLTTPNRYGFTVVEWGGVEIK